MTQPLPCSLQECVVCNMLTLHKWSHTGLFRHIGNHAFSFQYLRKKSAMCLIFFFFSKLLQFDALSEMEKKIEKMFWILEKIAFQLISLNNQFYRDKILVIGSQYVNKQSQYFRYY